MKESLSTFSILLCSSGPSRCPPSLSPRNARQCDRSGTGSSPVLARYMAHTIGPADPAWAQDHSRAPPRLPGKTPAEVDPLVGDIRPRLVTTTYTQGGVLALPWPRHPLGGAPWPEIWTIKRLLKRHGLVGQPTDQPRGGWGQLRRARSGVRDNEPSPQPSIRRQ
jgi:hypothetical protein